VTELTTSGALAGNYDPSGASFDEPQSMAIDASGNAWTVNYDGASVTEITSGGALVGNFAPAGAHLSNSVSLAIDASGNVCVANSDSP
jgi:hypothetical protein